MNMKKLVIASNSIALLGLLVLSYSVWIGVGLLLLLALVATEFRSSKQTSIYIGLLLAVVEFLALTHSWWLFLIVTSLLLWTSYKLIKSIKPTQSRQVQSATSAVLATRDMSKDELFEIEKDRLARQFGFPPSDRDVKWGLLNNALIECATACKWGFYRVVKYRMAEQVMSEGRDEHAMDLFLEVCYLDLNGPINGAGWDIELGMLAGVPVSNIVKLKEKLGLNDSMLEEKFSAVARRVKQNLRLPLDIPKAWVMLKKKVIEALP
jgi:hypothetical protein